MDQVEVRALHSTTGLLLDASPGGDVVEHELGEVGVAVDALDFGAGLDRWLTRPGGLSGWSVAIESAACGRGPLAQLVA